ncbi:acetylxylan esterase [Sporothrix schenckii 1099-18]|uniref:Carboxylic ester hydrolase n=1 Tax=Sporothrix schenckii 1099-18 TaxID=1397361 RepID=A0A0F2MFF1_SPOSC|nr:acetylxylan esterase [Sporothrix schenckii 1099-18]KJR88362.1 acetylxylan esterase [Sporothrix schenckii 1099-18]
MKLIISVLGALVGVHTALAGPALGTTVYDDLLSPVAPLSHATESLVQVTDFGPNLSNTEMYIYVPAKLADKPAIIVAIHYCTGTAQAYYKNSPYAQLADQKGFIVIFPSSPYNGTCWDVSSPSALVHNGGGDSNSIANMVTYTLDKYKADPAKVFVTGTSSGAMMTNVMAAAYPEMFAAGIVYSGVPAGCFYSQAGGVDAWNSSCANGEINSTPAIWAGIVDAMDPDFSAKHPTSAEAIAARPKMQIYHGSADDILFPPNYNETIKEWCGVFGFDPNAPDTTQVDVPQAGYTTYTWGAGKLVGVYAQGVGHTVPIRGADDMTYFGL